MLHRLVSVLCRRAVARAAAVQTQQTRSSSFSNVGVPIIPPCYKSSLDNGIRVITEQSTSPLACVAIFAEAGSRYETVCNNGACHFFELLSVRGLRTLSRGHFQECLRELGAHLDIHTDREYQAFICRCNQEAVYPVINLMSRLFYELECNDCEITCAKRDAFQLLGEIETDYKKLCFDYLHQTAYQGTSLALAPEGPSKNYDQFDAPFLKEFIKHQYQPFRIIFSVSSIHSHHDVFCKVQCELACLCQTTSETVDWSRRYTGSMLRYRDDDLPFCHIAIAVEVGGYNSPDYWGYRMMKHIIGRWDESQQQGYNTWPLLAHACALSKLCYRYESFYLPYKDTGLWGIYFVINKEDDYEDAILMIQDQWMQMCNKLAEPDVQRAEASLKMELAKSVVSCVDTCIDMGLQVLYNNSRYNLIEMCDRLSQWDNLKIQALAHKSIYDRCCAVSAVGPTEAVPDYNRTRAGMYWLRF
ncbi:insulinase (Peptidase family m16) domain-containing protein [Phthorimaea operculella]|nr:insulinase (Peptidase family m16) domain-containing protein [Phthorimaea operculella]